MAARWAKLADDGAHYRLAFDKPGTWSQKYNLVWDDILNLNLFPDEIARREVRHYLSKLNRYGLPLDSRSAYTKLDWCVWTACLTDSQADFGKLVEPLARAMNDTPNRVPMTDWFMTTDAKQVGFQARSVVGGLFLPMLRDRSMWKKWAR
jgi:hypothetical protein